MEDEYEQRISDLQTDLNIIRQRLQVEFVVVIFDVVVIGNVVVDYVVIVVYARVVNFFCSPLKQVGQNYGQNCLMLYVGNVIVICC